jgi:hypothetical protein
MTNPLQDIVGSLKVFAAPLLGYAIPDTEAALTAIAEVERFYLPPLLAAENSFDRLMWTQLAGMRLGQATGHLRNAEMIAGIGFRVIG